MTKLAEYRKAIASGIAACMAVTTVTAVVTFVAGTVMVLAYGWASGSLLLALSATTVALSFAATAALAWAERE